jgi:hypothetical protein
MSSFSPSKGIFRVQDCDVKSDKLRREGNEKYKNAFITHKDTHSPIGLRIADGNEALRLYRLALSAAGNSVTASLAARKNIGMAHLRLADLPFQEKLKSKV